MNKALALSAFALIMALPLVSSAVSIENTFLTSTTGTNAILVGDTIQFEVVLFIDSGFDVDTLLFTLSGDRDAAPSSTQGSGWAGVDNLVSGWSWNYTASGGRVKFGTNGRVAPLPAPAPTPDLVTGPYGFFGILKVGDGVPSMVGTVTITANTLGSYSGGAYLHPGVGTIEAFGTAYDVTITGGAFDVVPEPGTALLMMLGLGGLGIMGRSNRK
ncbi:MAG: PEP-CTERM sorting domain-containing protein [Myxococcales bacterium]|nr:PEP-CTERM sorting domain-containing protein [Myxococcales bacterium]